MPEGPEVKIIVDNLKTLLINDSLAAVDILGGRYIDNQPEYYQEFISLLPLKIESVNCKGKFIWFQFEKDWSMWCTLGMAGSWKHNATKHSDIQFTTFNNDLWFTDPRHFGTIKFCKDPKLLTKKLKTLGPDMLSDSEYTEDEFCQRIRRYNKHDLCKVLMNQTYFSGIGNYLKAEILYASKISPFRKLSDISDEEIKILFQNIRKIITASYKARGATIKNYSDLEDNKGEYTFQFKVYNQTKDENGYIVKKTVTSDNRTTHWVPEVQK